MYAFCENERESRIYVGKRKRRKIIELAYAQEGSGFEVSSLIIRGIFHSQLFVVKSNSEFKGPVRIGVLHFMHRMDYVVLFKCNS